MSDLAAKVVELEKQLEAAHGEILVLKSAVTHLAQRLENIPELGPVVGGSVRVTKKPSRPSIANVAAPARPSTATPAKPATPAKEEKNSTPSRPATAAKPAPASADKKTPAKTAAPSKVLTVRTTDEKASSAKQTFDKSRTGKYNVGKASIFYHLPSTMPPIAELPAPAEAKSGLKLDYVYGFNGNKIRNSLSFSKTEPGFLVYSVAATGVVWNPTTNVQRHYTGHVEDILSIAVHPSKPLAVTGQLDSKGAGDAVPFFAVWNTETLQLVKKIYYHARGVGNVAFSGDGKYIFSIGNDDSHTLAIWDWENTTGTSKKGVETFTPLIDMMTSKDDVFGIAVNPKVDEKGEVSFVTYGAKTAKYWKSTNLTAADKKTRKLESKVPSAFQKTGVVQASFDSAAFVPGTEDYFLGTHTGDIYKCNGGNFTKAWKAHAKPVGTLVAYDTGIISAADDGKIILWDFEGKQLDVIELGKALPRSIAKEGDRIVVGTAKNSLIEVDVKTKEHKVIMQGHNDEVWAIAPHPTEPVFASGAHDKQLHLWNTQSKTLAKSLAFKARVRSATFSHDGKYIAVGLQDEKDKSGSIALVDYANWSVVFEVKVSPETVDAIQFSPDNSTVAGASWDQKVHFVSVPDGKKKGSLKGHTSSVLMLNYSVDGRFLMTNSRDYEILYWNIAEQKRVDLTEELIDMKWQGWNCFLGWPVVGIWAGAGDGTDINSVDRSHSETALAAGDDFGKVRLYAYPACHKNAPVKEYLGHSSHVPSVRFSGDDSLLFSAGGDDNGVFQWIHA